MSGEQLIREIGRSGVSASAVGLGTWAIGGWMWGGTDETQSIAAIQASLDAGIVGRLGVAKKLLAVRNTRGGIGKASMVLNDATPHIEVDPETYEVRADGELLTCEPATVLPMAQRYFLF